MEQTCAACGTVVTQLHPWWFDTAMVAALVTVCVALALINWERWTRRGR